MTTQHAQKSSSTAGETLLFEGKTDGILRILSAVSLVFALGGIVLAAMLLDTNVRLGNGVTGNERAVWAGGLMLLFVGFFAAVGMYRRRVASKITLMADGRHMRIETPTMFGRGSSTINLDDVVLSRYHGGDGAGEESLADAWLHIQVRNQRSFLVPLGGHIPDKKRLLSLLSATR